jgi:succinate dehydrogenase / fumarate reductase membrane anchor subunit
MQFRSPVKQAKGLGSAHYGTAHWWAQRVTSVALVPLMLWFVAGIAAGSGAGHADAVAWIGSPVNAVLLVLLLAVSCYHGALGVQVVLEDYVGNHALQIAAIVLVKFAATVLATAGIFAVLSIAFGG